MQFFIIILNYNGIGMDTLAAVVFVDPINFEVRASD
jgi:hypothetical protein